MDYSKDLWVGALDLVQDSADNDAAGLPATFLHAIPSTFIGRIFILGAAVSSIVDGYELVFSFLEV